MNLAGWKLGDGSTTVELPATAQVDAGSTAWIARDSAAFSRQFGFAPDIITTGWPGFANQGDEVLLILPDSRVADGLVYGSGSVTQSWWQGAAVQPFRAGGLFAVEGQILYRRSDPGRGSASRIPTAGPTGRRRRTMFWAGARYNTPAGSWTASSFPCR